MEPKNKPQSGVVESKEPRSPKTEGVTPKSNHLSEDQIKIKEANDRMDRIERSLESLTESLANHFTKKTAPERTADQIWSTAKKNLTK